MEELTDFLSNDLIAPSIHMATIDIDVLIHIKRIGEIMNPIQMFSFFDFHLPSLIVYYILRLLSKITLSNSVSSSIGVRHN